jgi:hypothetical protein
MSSTCIERFYKIAFLVVAGFAGEFLGARAETIGMSCEI